MSCQAEGAVLYAALVWRREILLHTRPSREAPSPSPGHETELARRQPPSLVTSALRIFGIRTSFVSGCDSVMARRHAIASVATSMKLVIVLYWSRWARGWADGEVGRVGRAGLGRQVGDGMATGHLAIVAASLQHKSYDFELHEG